MSVHDKHSSGMDLRWSNFLSCLSFSTYLTTNSINQSINPILYENCSYINQIIIYIFKLSPPFFGKYLMLVQEEIVWWLKPGQESDG